MAQPATSALRTLWVGRVGATIAGLLLPLSLAPYNIWPLGLVSAALLLYLFEREPARCAGLGWWFAVGKYGLGASWVYVSIHEHGNAPVPLALFMVALFVGGMALFGLTQGWTYGRLRQRRVMPSADVPVPKTQILLGNSLLFVLLWILWEWFLTWVLTGFPWLLLGNGHTETALTGFAPVGGVLLVSGLVALTAVCILYVLVNLIQYRFGGAKPSMVGIGAASLLMVVPWIVGQLILDRTWVSLGEPQSVALVQNNIDQRSKWTAERRQPIVQEQLVLTRPHWGKSLIVWPEASVTYFEHQAELLLQDIDRRAKAAGSSLVLGIPSLTWQPQGEAEFRNTALALGEGSGRYVKRHLVPFGEYVPLASLLRGLVEFFDLPMSRTEPGDVDQPLLQLGEDRAAMALCYEIAYPGLVASHQGEANVLLTLSNDAWFGRSIGPHQHLQIARMRALENGRYVLRSTQSGITAIIDERGRVVAQLPQFTAAVLSGHYRSARGQTPFVAWGLIPALLLVVLLGSVVVSLRARFLA